MSTDILPFAVWQSGTNENSIPANDNALRSEILNGLIISDSTTAQPGSPADGDIYIIPAGATGSQWATFDENDLSIYHGGTWYAYAPVEGIVVNLAGVLTRWNGSSYVDASGGSAGRNSVTALSIATGVVDIDCSLGDYFTLSLTANVTSITFSNLPGSGKGAAIAVRIRQDGTGSRTVALPSSFKAISGSDTAVQSAANAYTILMLTTLDNGTRWEYSMKAGTA
jgi:hypothetical protein